MKDKILAGILTLIIAVSAGFGGGYIATKAFSPSLSGAIATPVASFETSLAETISTTATSMTLVSTTTDDGVSLVASRLYGFTIDEGTPNLEYVLGYMSSSTEKRVLYMTRGISTVTGTTSISALQKRHGRGALVKVSDHPVLVQLAKILNGEETIPNVLLYQSGTGCDSASNGQVLCNASYIRNLANSGAATSTESIGGITELATASEQSSGFYGGVDVPTVLQSKNSSSTPTIGCDGSVTAGKWCVPVAKSNGKLWQGWLDLTEHFIFSSLFATNASSTNATTTNFAVTSPGTFTVESGVTISGVGQTASTSIWSANGTWTKPSGAKFVDVFVFAAGAGGGSGARNVTASSAGGGTGGGGGSFAAKRFVASALGSTEAIAVGTGGAGGVARSGSDQVGADGVDGGASSFGTSVLLRAPGGSKGLAGGSGASYAGGAGGIIGNGEVTQAGGAGGGSTQNSAGTVGVSTDNLVSSRGGGGGGSASGSAAGAAGGGFTTNYVLAGGAIATVGNTPTSGLLVGGTGGGGSTGVAGSGTVSTAGAGGVPGGGGGGGGGTGSGTSGAGGTGGNGMVVVITYF